MMVGERNGHYTQNGANAAEIMRLMGPSGVVLGSMQ